jgi:hypothetical protein
MHRKTILHTDYFIIYLPENRGINELVILKSWNQVLLKCVPDGANTLIFTDGVAYLNKISN